MNKKTLVFALGAALLSPVYAQLVISNEVKTGTSGLPAEEAYVITNANIPALIIDSELTGGSSVWNNQPTNAPFASGAAAVRAPLIGAFGSKTMEIYSSTLQGGQGAAITLAAAPTVNVAVNGGIGLQSVRGDITSTNSAFLGGNGGTFSGPSGAYTISANGGNGISLSVGSLSLTDGTAEGGQGGKVNAGGATSASANGGVGISLFNMTKARVIAGSDISGGDGGAATNGTSLATANGGAGLRIENVSGSVVISDSVLAGGDGGSAKGSSLSTAAGGAGLLLINAANVTISDTIITNGSGGVVNGAAGLDGAGISMQGSTVNLIGGELYGELLFAGGVNTISLQGTTMDAARQTGGTVNVNDWDDGVHFQNTLISGGTMNFNGQGFTLQSGSSFKLGHGSTTAAAMFNGGLTVQSGAVLDLGLGTVGGSDIELQDGSQIVSDYDGIDEGQIDAAGDLTIGSDVQWAINILSGNLASGTMIDIAKYSGTLNSGLTVDDITFLGGGEFGGTWLDTLSLENTPGLLTVVYEQLPFDEALGTDPSTDFGKAMSDLSKLVLPGTPGYDRIASLPNPAVAEVILANTYVRTAEMANSLISLQSIFSDQIRDRTRSYLRDQEVGYPAAPTPVGSAGWEAMRSFSDRLEDSFGADEVQSMVDAVTPDIELDLMGTIDAVTPDVKIDPLTLPASYKTWGRGYGSFIDQKESDEFPGYEATIGGGILGIDKQINNVLLGLAGGYARTDLEGDAEKDGTSDTGHASLYFSANGERLFLDANVNYAFNSVETEYDPFGFEADYDVHTVGLYLGGGYVITIADRVLLTPEASILSTYYTRDSYTESSLFFPDLKWDSYDEWSHLGTLGATLSMIRKVDFRDAQVAIQPEVRAHWLHEFNDEFDDEEYKMVGGDYTVGASLLAREEDLLKVGAGVRLSKWDTDTTEIGLDFDGTYGDDYDAYMISGKIMHRF